MASIISIFIISTILISAAQSHRQQSPLFEYVECKIKSNQTLSDALIAVLESKSMNRYIRNSSNSSNGQEVNFRGLFEPTNLVQLESFLQQSVFPILSTWTSKQIQLDINTIKDFLANLNQTRRLVDIFNKHAHHANNLTKYVINNQTVDLASALNDLKAFQVINDFVEIRVWRMRSTV